MQTDTSTDKAKLEHAIALHLATTPHMGGIGERIANIVKSIRKSLGNSLITQSTVKEIIEQWVKRQWVTIKNDYVAMTESGKKQIDSIAALA